MTLVVDLPPLPVTAGPTVRLLERVALALNSTLELHEVLALLAEAGLEATGAGGTAVLLLERRRLVPATVVRVVADDTLQDRFHGMDPIELDDFRWQLLQAGRAIVFEDARTTDLVPPELIDRFTLRGFALVPIMAGGEPHGVMCVDWDEVRSFSPNDVTLLEAIGTYAGTAVRNARMYETARRRAKLQEALAHSAASLASPLDPGVIAGRLVEAYTELLGARLCAVVLIDADRATITSVASKGVPPIPEGTPVAQLPGAIVGRLFRAWEGAKQPVEFGDEDWLGDVIGGRAVGAAWYLFLPLLVEGHTRGVVVLGFAAATVLDGQERSAAAALADLASAAIERHELLARLDAQVGRLDALYEASAALNSSSSLQAVLDLVCAAFENLLGTSHCSVNLIGEADDHLLRTLAHRGVPWFAGRPESLSAVAPSQLDRARALWAERATPVVFATTDEGPAVDAALVPPSVRSAALFPLLRADGVLGVVVAGFPRSAAMRSEDLDTGQALAGLAAAAIDRAQLNDGLRFRLRQVEALYRLSDVVAGRAELDSAVAELNRVLEPELGVSFGWVAVANRATRAAVGARRPDPEEGGAIRAWRHRLTSRTAVPRPRATANGLLVPVVHRSQVYGSLRVLARGRSVDAATEDLLTAIGGGCAEIIYKARLHRDLADRERRLVIAAERERIARDLHDSVGQVLTGMGMLLNEYLVETEDDAWRERLEGLVAAAGQGAQDVRDSIHALMFIETRQVGLIESLGELTAKFRSMTGIPVEFEVNGEPVPLSTPKDDALFRTAHEALTNVERHASASRVTVALAYEANEVRLIVTDDGVGLGVGIASDGLHFGLTGIERRLDEVGGELVVSTGDGAGAVVMACVGIKSRAPSRV